MPSPSKQYLFVYGTLISSSGHPMSLLLRRGARGPIPATMSGRLYDLGAYPGAVRCEDGRGRVHGEVYAMPGLASPLWRTLDEYEGCGRSAPPPHTFIRELVEVRLHDGRSVEAWTYLYNRPVNGTREIPGGRYLPARHIGRAGIR